MNPTQSTDEMLTLVNEYVEEVYRDLSGYVQYEKGEREAAEEKKIFLTYGEITFQALLQILGNLDLSEEDVFVDLGSGIGKVCLQVFLLSPVRKTMGIEAMAVRYEQSLQMLKDVQPELPQHFAAGRDMTFQCGNFLEADLSEATFAYMCSTCYSDELLAAIGKMISQYPKIRYLLSLKPVPCEGMTLWKEEPVECSWGNSTCYIYVRD